MTSTPIETRPFRSEELGTLVLLAWTGETPDGDLPYLLAYCLGDAADGPEASSSAVRKLLEDNGLTVGGDVVDGNEEPGVTVGLLVEAGDAVVSLPSLVARCAAPPNWLAAVAERGYAHLVFTTRPWPEAVPGKPVRADVLAAFIGAEETLKAAAHVVLPAHSPDA